LITRAMHERVTIRVAPSERAEAELVVHTIEQLIGGHSFFSLDSGRADGAADNLSFSDFAVLYRTDAQSLCEAIARSGMPFQRHAHAPLAERPEIAALLAALDDGADDRPPAALLRAAAERAGPDAAAILPQLAALAGPVAPRAEVAELLTQATDADLWDARADRVSLLTLHAAKGLEFPVVFIVGLEDGLLPLRFGGSGDAAAVDEERRLLYVGMTRAKDRLFLSRAQRRLWRGQLRALPPSPFLDAIEEELARHQPALVPRRKADSQLTLF
jgi:DNA helicase-2/ATP-dependent DNA helicase PcrA